MPPRKLKTVAVVVAVLLSLLCRPMPASAGWVQVWRQDFNGTTLPANIATYSGGTFHPEESLTIANGELVMWLHNRLRPTGWESVRSAIVPTAAGRYLNTRYGEYQWSMIAQPDSGGLAGWNITGLLWPETNNPTDGEIDFPEWHPGGPMMTFAHQATGQPGCPTVQAIHKIVDGPGPLGVWHTYGIRWSPAGFSFWIDGRKYWETTCGQPRTPMHLVIQIGADPGRDGVAPATSHGHVRIGWMLVKRYVA